MNDEALKELWEHWQTAVQYGSFERAHEYREMYLGLLALKQQEPE